MKTKRKISKYKITKHKKSNSFRKTHKKYRKKNIKYNKNITKKGFGGNGLARLANVAKNLTRKVKSDTLAGLGNISTGTEIPFKRPINNQQLMDNLRRKNKPQQTTNITGLDELKKGFNRIANKYDSITDPLYHIPMDENGRYKFTTPGQGSPKPGDIASFDNPHEKTWKKFKFKRTGEEFFRQKAPDVTKMAYESDEEKKDEEENDEEEKKDEEEVWKIDEPPLQLDVGKGFYTTSILTPSFKIAYEQIGIERDYQRIFNYEVRVTFDKIRDQTLKQKVVEYDKNTQNYSEFIGWNECANKAGLPQTEFNDSKDIIIKKTGQDIALAKFKIVKKYLNIQQNTYYRNIAHYGSYLPKGIVTGWGLINWGTIETTCSIWNMSVGIWIYETAVKKVDWSKPENIDSWNKNLVTTLDNSLEFLLKDITKQGCNNSIPNIAKRIINPASVDKIVNFVKGEAITNANFGLLVDKSSDFCNKILPVVANYVKKNGFSKGIGEEAIELLNPYLKESLSLVKEILWDVVQNTGSEILNDESSVYIDEVFGDREIIYSLADEEKRERFDKIFDIKAVKHVAKILGKVAEKVQSDINENIDQTKVNQVVKELNTGIIPQEIIEAENNLKEIIGNHLTEIDPNDKVKISDFIINLNIAVAKLLNLWDKEIYDKGLLDNKYSAADCLLNIVDLRASTLLMETCTIYAKGLLPDEICNEKFYNLIEVFYSKPIEDINSDDLKNTIKNMIIDAMVENAKNKYISLSESTNKELEEIMNPTYATIFGYYCIV